MKREVLTSGMIKEEAEKSSLDSGSIGLLNAIAKRLKGRVDGYVDTWLTTHYPNSR